MHVSSGCRTARATPIERLFLKQRRPASTILATLGQQHHRGTHWENPTGEVTSIRKRKVIRHHLLFPSRHVRTMAAPARKHSIGVKLTTVQLDAPPRPGDADAQYPSFCTNTTGPLYLRLPPPKYATIAIAKTPAYTTLLQFIVCTVTCFITGKNPIVVDRTTNRRL